MTLEHYPGMTEGAIRKIVDEARSQWQVMDCTVIHRDRELQPNDQIVLVAVASSHRADAFAACQFIMDYLKTQAPFWKKEHRPEGARWQRLHRDHAVRPREVRGRQGVGLPACRPAAAHLVPAARRSTASFRRPTAATRVAALWPGAHARRRRSARHLRASASARSRTAEILLAARVVGGLQMIDRGEADDKIVAVLEGDYVWGQCRDIADAADRPGRAAPALLPDLQAGAGAPARSTIGATYGVERALQGGREPLAGGLRAAQPAVDFRELSAGRGLRSCFGRDEELTDRTSPGCSAGRRSRCALRCRTPSAR